MGWLSNFNENIGANKHEGRRSRTSFIPSNGRLFLSNIRRKESSMKSSKTKELSTLQKPNVHFQA
jgi:hypothetical protein